MMTHSHPSKPRAEIQTDLALSRQNGDAATEAACLIALGDIAKENEEYDLAQGLYGQAWAAYKHIGDRPGQTKALFALADLTTRDATILNNRTDQNVFYQEAVNLAKDFEDISGQGTIWLAWADFLVYMESPWETVRLFRQNALACFEKTNDMPGQGDALFALAKMDMGVDAPRNEQRGKELYEKALMFYKQADISLKEAEALHHFGVYVGDHISREEGTIHLTRSLSIYKQLGAVQKQFPVYRCLARFACDYNEARQYYEAALSCDVNNELSPEKAYEEKFCTLQTMSELAIKTHHEDANQDLERILALVDISSTIRRKLQIFKLVSKINADLKEFDRARHYIQEALALCQEPDAKLDHPYVLWQSGRIEILAGQHEKGCSILKDILEGLRQKNISSPFRSELNFLEQEFKKYGCGDIS
jgi:tetratricopeptide (TPR) repeat protein